MIWSLYALGIGYVIDLLIGDPYCIPHPVVAMGKAISFLEKSFRKAFPKSARGEKWAGFFIWLIMVLFSAAIPLGILWGAHLISPWLRLGLESIMCWQILATRSLSKESMKVSKALETGDIDKSRYAVSMIVGRDTDRLDEAGVVKAVVETVAENTSDGVIAPMFYMFLGGAPLGFFYKAVNTMDSMLGYIDPPYTHIGFVPAKADDFFNLIPARLTAVLMGIAGFFRRLDVKSGFRIYRRDRKKHASPNSAHCESMCAGLMGISLNGPAYYRGVYHEKPVLGDDRRPVDKKDIKLACSLMFITSFISMLVLCGIKLPLCLFVFHF